MSVQYAIWTTVMLDVWGYCDTGARDFAAGIAEERGQHHMPYWDETSRHLDHLWLNGERPPDMFATYWVLEHVRRGHEVLPQWR